MKKQEKKETQEKRFDDRPFDIYFFGVDERLINRFWLRKLINTLMEYDEFVKEVDLILESNLLKFKKVEDRQRELDLLIKSIAQNVIVVDLALKFLSHQIDIGARQVLDENYKKKLKGFKGF